MQVDQARNCLESITEFEGGPYAISYRVRGHIDKAVFQQALFSELGVSAPLEIIEHSYYRNIPAGPDMPGVVIYWPSKKGRGAYPVTEVDACSRLVTVQDGKA